ncbi:MAG: calcium/proton exchanger [Actinomycetota bacterium]|nr:calcium/proton exchanger [Actinomycetota bacterium]
MLSALSPIQRIVALAGLVFTIIAGMAQFGGGGEVLRFVLSGLALGALAAVVGQAIEALGEKLGPSPTALVQSTLGNLPELFVGIFALRAGLTGVVKAALVGSVLGNVLLVLGMAFIAGGLRHGTQKFDPEEPRLNATLLLLAVAALLVPTLAHQLNTPAASHSGQLSDVTAIVLLVVYAASVPFYLRRRSAAVHRTVTVGLPVSPGPSGEAVTSPSDDLASWPLGLSLAMLAAGSAGAAFVSDWFVAALTPATHSLGLSQTFTGLVVVALASNAVEHAVGIRFALRAKPEFAISTTLNSPLQVALLLTPVLVLLSAVVGPSKLTLVFPPLLVAALAVSAVVVVAVIYDGEYIWLEGVALVGLYFIIAASFWWG